MYKCLANVKACLRPPSTARHQSIPAEDWPLPKNQVAHLWHADLDEDRFNVETITSEEEERAWRFRRPLHQKRFIHGRSLLRYLAGHYLQCDPREIRFVDGPAGKPGIIHPARTKLYFNVAHSHATILIAFSTAAEIGVDIEWERTLPDETQLVERFFHPDEIAAYRALPPSLRSRGFANAWTRKEAVLKACGEGLQGRLDSFSVSLEPDEPCRLLLPPHDQNRSVQWTLTAPEIGSGIAAALAAMSTLERVRVQRFNADISTFHGIS